MNTLAINEHFILSFTIDNKHIDRVLRRLRKLNIEIDCTEQMNGKVKVWIIVKGLLTDPNIPEIAKLVRSGNVSPINQ